MQLDRVRGNTTRKLAIGFGIGVALIVCTMGARALVDGGTTAGNAAAQAPSAPAALEAPETDAQPTGLTGDVTSPTEVLVSLLVVIGVMVLVLWGISRLMRRARLAPGRAKVLGLVDALSLGSKRQVFVVSYKDRTLLLGCGSEDIQLLAEYEATDFPVEQDDEAGESASSPAAHTPSIAASLVDAAEDKVEISAAARDAGAPPSMPTGAHRVPPAFRHLLQESVERSEG